MPDPRRPLPRTARPRHRLPRPRRPVEGSQREREARQPHREGGLWVRLPGRLPTEGKPDAKERRRQNAATNSSRSGH